MESRRDETLGLWGCWMPCRHAPRFVGLEPTAGVRADPYRAPYRGIQLTLSRNFSSPRVSEARPLAMRVPSTERISSRPTFENLFELSSSAIGTAPKRAVFFLLINKYSEAPLSHPSTSLPDPTDLRPHHFIRLRPLPQTWDLLMLWGTWIQVDAIAYADA